MKENKDSESGFLAKSAEIAGRFGRKAMELANIAKLNAEISLEKEKVRKAQLEIGKIYFEKCSDAPHPLLAGCCDKIKSSLEAIDLKKQSIEAIKHRKNDRDSGELSEE